MQDALLGLDVGTSAVKAVLFDVTGAELAAATRSYTIDTPQAGWAEQDPEAVWQATISSLREVAKAAAGKFNILALAMAAQCGSTLPAKADGTPLYPLITWLDQRTGNLVARWRAEGAEESVRHLSGWRLHPGLPLPTIAWLREYRPDIFAAAERYLNIADFLARRLTGRTATNPSTGAEMQFVDVATGGWSSELCALAGITPGHLPDLRPSGAIIGALTAKAAAQTGLPAGTPLVNGGHDQCCSALAMGLTDPGKLMLATGTAWVITGVTNSPDVAAVPPQMDLNFHVTPGRWTVSQLLGSFGATVDWWLRQIWQRVPPEPQLSAKELYGRLNTALAHSEPGSHGLLFLPLTGGAQIEPNRPGGGFVGLRLDHGRSDFAQAIFEGAAFEVCWALETLRQHGAPVKQMWLAGGATRNPHWPQILANVTGVPVTLAKYAGWPALGAAILAGVGAGVFDVETGVARFKRAGRQLVPDVSLRALYAERFAAYRQASRLLAQMEL